MADQAITALPKKTYSGSSQIASTDYLLGIDSAEGYQMLIQDLGEYIINRVTASLAGSTQTLASAISALNSKNYTDQASGNSLLDFVATLDKGTYNFRLDNAPEAPVTGGITYTVIKTHTVGDTRCSIIATAMYSSDPDIYSAFVGQNATSITWKKAAKQSDVDVLNSKFKGRTAYTPTITGGSGFQASNINFAYIQVGNCLIINGRFKIDNAGTEASTFSGPAFTLPTGYSCEDAVGAVGYVATQSSITDNFSKLSVRQGANKYWIQVAAGGVGALAILPADYIIIQAIIMIN